jgi:hypothetical protein
MKASVILLAASVSLGVAMAQTNPPDPQTQPKPQITPPPQSQTTPQTQTTPNTQATPQTATTKSSTTPAEMNTKTYKGTLVDMSCASKEAASMSKPSDETNAANRTAPDAATPAAGNCTVSASSTELGMKMKDGRTVRFDLVGNQRAQDCLKSDKHWSKDLTAGKPIQATVIGVLNGEKLIVSSIH